MRTHLIYTKDKFEGELNSFIEKGLSIIKTIKEQGTNVEIFKKNEYKFNLWKDEVNEFLKQRFDNPNNEYLNDFLNAGRLESVSMSAVLRRENPNSFEFKLRYFALEVGTKVNSLIKLGRKLKFIPVKDVEIIIENKNIVPKRVFISHSSLDKKFVEKIIDTLEVIGVSSENIFCSSFEGYGVELGANFLDVIKEELSGNVLVIFILSTNFYSSIVSICEMGATWVKTNQHIPILIPPFDYKDIEGVIPNTHGMKINERDKFNSLKERVEIFFELKTIKENIWERKRDKIINEIDELLK
ncbi:MAG: toll/interleukin-1 receptor domain-containing protein [Bacilli bacterium]